MDKREIKFRAKGVDGEWWYGGSNPAREYRHVNLATFFANLYADQLDPATLGGYTGLYDKNGKEIYEGDILTYNRAVLTSRYEVIIKDGHTQLILRDANVTPLHFFLDISNKDLYYIAGNIYENPELLTGVKKNE